MTVFLVANDDLTEVMHKMKDYHGENLNSSQIHEIEKTKKKKTFILNAILAKHGVSIGRTKLSGSM